MKSSMAADEIEQLHVSLLPAEGVGRAKTYGRAEGAAKSVRTGRGAHRPAPNVAFQPSVSLADPHLSSLSRPGVSTLQGHKRPAP